MTQVKVRESLPEVYLLDAQGRKVLLRSLHPNRPLALFLFHGDQCAGCRRKLREFAANFHRYAELPATVAAVALDPQADLAALAGELTAAGLRFPGILAHDPSGKLIDRFAPAGPAGGERTPCCILTNLFDEIYASLHGEDAIQQPEVLDWLDFIDMQCPE